MVGELVVVYFPLKRNFLWY